MAAGVSDARERNVVGDRPIAGELKWVLVTAAVLTMFFILYPDPIVGGAEAAAKSLLAR